MCMLKYTLTDGLKVPAEVNKHIEKNCPVLHNCHSHMNALRFEMLRQIYLVVFNKVGDVSISSTQISGKQRVITLEKFIDLLKRIESVNSNLSALEIARKIHVTKYPKYQTATGFGFSLLLPSTNETKPITAERNITIDDIIILSKEGEVTLPEGGLLDISHVITGIVAAYETKPPSIKLLDLRPTVSQLDIASWVGDI
jgi:hypothetical protein